MHTARTRKLMQRAVVPAALAADGAAMGQGRLNIEGGMR